MRSWKHNKHYSFHLSLYVVYGTQAAVHSIKTPLVPMKYKINRFKGCMTILLNESNLNF